MCGLTAQKPRSHVMHVDILLFVLYVPSLQLVHSAAPVCEYFPASHSTHREWLGLAKEPAGQGSIIAFSIAVTAPGSHRSHALAPEKSLYDLANSWRTYDEMCCRFVRNIFQHHNRHTVPCLLARNKFQPRTMNILLRLITHCTCQENKCCMSLHRVSAKNFPT